MDKLVSIEKLNDGKIKITINRMPNTSNHYNILIRKGGVINFEENVFGQTLYNAKTYFDNDKQSRLHWHIHLYQDVDNAKYSIIFNNTPWVKSNIKDITSQILNIEQGMLVDIALKRHASSIAKAIKTNDYKSLIQQMIIDNSDKLSNEDIIDIQRTLTDVKEERGLSTRPPIKFGL